MQLVFASANQNKISEIRSMLPRGFQLLGLKDIGIFDEIPETGTTIKENSLLKANYVFNFLKQRNEKHFVFSDDSGLEVEALNNAPGVYSARYSGEPKNDEGNNIKLLHDLENSVNRTARFVTVITLITDNDKFYFDGEVKGHITKKPYGNGGFGYDPIFIPDGFSETFAQLNHETKNSISHRAKAIKKLIDFLHAL